MIECSFWFRPGTTKLIKVKELLDELTVASPPGIEPTVFVRRPHLDRYANNKPVYVNKKWAEGE